MMIMPLNHQHAHRWQWQHNNDNNNNNNKNHVRATNNGTYDDSALGFVVVKF
jgi:hypothetical protein